jgi:hypothetical protein
MQTATCLLSAIETYIEDILPITATKANLGLQIVSTMPTIRSNLPDVEEWEELQNKIGTYQLQTAALNPYQPAQDVTTNLKQLKAAKIIQERKVIYRKNQEYNKYGNNKLYSINNNSGSCDRHATAKMPIAARLAII